MAIGMTPLDCQWSVGVELDWQRKREPARMYQLEVELEIEVGVDTAFPLEHQTHGRILSLASTQASSC